MFMCVAYISYPSLVLDFSNWKFNVELTIWCVLCWEMENKIQHTKPVLQVLYERIICIEARRNIYVYKKIKVFSLFTTKMRYKIYFIDFIYLIHVHGHLHKKKLIYKHKHRNLYYKWEIVAQYIDSNQFK